MAGMDLKLLLLLVAFRHRIRESDLGSGLWKFEEIIGRSVSVDDFRHTLAEALATGHVYDPVRLPPGALQCHWHLELTPKGASKIRALLQKRRVTADELIALTSRLDSKDGQDKEAL